MINPDWLIRWTARGLLVPMIWSCADWRSAQAQQGTAQATPQATPQVSSPAETNRSDSPDASGAENTSTSSSAAGYPDAPEPQNEVPANPQSGSGQSSGDGKPVGTAAAPYTKPSGVAGSRPAGAAIAPAKQRRARAILISVGVLAAAGIAVGTVAGLSHASPSRPN